MTSSITSHILITGAAGGLGCACARAFAAPGVLAGLQYCRSREKAAMLEADLLGRGATPYLIQADFSNLDAAGIVADDVQSRAEILDVVILNAGIAPNALIVRTNENLWDCVFAVNYQTPVRLCRLLAESCLRDGSHVVIVGSLAGLRGRKGAAAYAASKAAITGFAVDAARQFGPRGICVNAVLPGWLETPMTSALPPDQWKTSVAENTLGRPATCAEIAAFIKNLTSCRHISGQVLGLDSRSW